MIFGVVVAILIVCLVIRLVVNYFLDPYLLLDSQLFIKTLSEVIVVVSGFMATIMLVCIVIAHVGVEGTIRKYDEQYKGLIYKMQTEDCRDEFGILNKDFVDEIQEWNMKIASNQSWQKDFWVGIFYPPVYDDLKLIDLNEFSYKTQTLNN